jgi:hypothetical protein
VDRDFGTYSVVLVDLPALADGYTGAGIGVDVDNRTYNALLCGLRCLGQRGFDVLTDWWRCLRHITASEHGR